jgi:hypothetical protein
VTYREIDVSPFAHLPLAPHRVGTKPDLRWLKVDSLIVDDGYRRPIGRAGIADVRCIAAEFRWEKFFVVVVAPTSDGRFAIIDGQRRVTAAAVRGIQEVPCLVLRLSKAEQASMHRSGRKCRK